MRPYLFLDIDGVLHGTRMQYGYERTVNVVEHIARDLVHPALRPRRFSGREITDDRTDTRRSPESIRLSTRVRVSRALLEDLDSLALDVLMLTTWLEHDSVDSFFRQGPVPNFSYRTLQFPGRDVTDPLGAIPAQWKVQQLRATMQIEPRPFIWIDDVEVPFWGEVIDEEFPEIPHLLIAPQEDIGLIRDDVEDIRDFLSAL